MGARGEGEGGGRGLGGGTCDDMPLKQKQQPSLLCGTDAVLAMDSHHEFSSY